MTPDMLALALILAAPLLAGGAFGLGYFAVLGRAVALFAAHPGGWAGPAALTVARLAAALVFFGFMAQRGAAPLLAAFLGFLAARGAALRLMRRED